MKYDCNINRSSLTFLFIYDFFLPDKTTCNLKYNYKSYGGIDFIHLFAIDRC